MNNSDLVLVVGGGGFIGSHIIPNLVEMGAKIRVLNRNRQLKSSMLAEGVECLSGDISCLEDMISALDGVTQIIYLANSTFPATSMNDMSFDLESNVLPLIRFLDYVKDQKKIRTFIYLSSGGAIYGDPHEFVPIPESHPTFPVSSYGLTKLIAENYIRLHLANSHVQGYALRVANAYGERQDLSRPQGAIGHFLKAALNNTAVTIYGAGDIVRDYIYAGDVASAVRSCLLDGSSLSKGLRVYNVGTGNGFSLLELINFIQNVTGKKLFIDYQPTRNFDIKYNVLNCAAIFGDLGWAPKISMEDGIKREWAWVENMEL